MFLVDANVLSEATKPLPDSRVVAWLRANEADLVVDAIVLGELRAGILIRPAGRKRDQLERWFAALAETVECVPWDARVSLRWASLIAALRRRGRSLPLLDSMIAATALEHEFTVVTRNVRDFRRAGVTVLDPFAQ
jgi:hypothetical protein